jgi:DNA-binding protein HU-beta
MNKADLVDVISENSGLTKKSGADVLESIVKGVKKSLSNGEKVSLMGFGSWEVISRNERKGRNPKTGKEIIIPARKVVKFNAGKELRDSI